MSTPPDITAPEIISRRTNRLSPWVGVEEVEVRMPGRDEIDTYHGLNLADTVSVLAMTRDGRIALVRQFRPIIGAWTWELPSGLRDAGEDPAQSAARELREETGLEAGELVPLVQTYESPARFTSRYTGFFALTASSDINTAHETDAVLVDGAHLKQLSAAGEIALPTNFACLYLAGLHPRVRELCAELGFSAPPWL